MTFCYQKEECRELDRGAARPMMEDRIARAEVSVANRDAEAVERSTCRTDDDVVAGVERDTAGADSVPEGGRLVVQSCWLSAASVLANPS
jgi:cell division GTPase FtsZ